MRKITEENWTFSHFENANMRAFISFGAEPDNIERPIYFLNLGDEEFRDIFQREFDNLQDSIDAINIQYGHWEYSERGQSSSGGCGTCEAH